MDTDSDGHPDTSDRETDPILAALAAAELDDEPYTDEERAAAKEGWEAYLAGRSIPFEEFRQRLLLDESSL